MERRPVTDPAADIWTGGPPLHIAIVLAGLGAGGAERVVSLLAGHWADAGRRVSLISFDAPDAAVFHPIDPRVDILRLGIDPGGGGWAGVRASLRRVTALRRTLERLRPDITISFLTKINVVTLLASLGTGRSVIVSERNNPHRQRASRLWTTTLAGLGWRADGIVMQTEASLSCLGRSARKRARVIPNPIRVDPAPSTLQRRKVLAATGRLTWQKGFDMLIDAFALIGLRHPDWELWIWGEGEDRPLLETRIEQYGLGERVRLRGNSRSPGEWVGQADAFALSSRYEGFPNALGEAMAAGLPVVAFDCDFGPGEMIRNGEDGLLIPDTDVPALAEALGRLMGDVDMQQRLGSTAKASARRYEADAVVRRWDELLMDVRAG